MKGFEIDLLPVTSGDKSGDSISFRYGDLQKGGDAQTVVILDAGFAKNASEMKAHLKKYYNCVTPEGKIRIDYMYLDNELVNVDHLCCFAHARAKFQYAFEQGKDADAEYFIRLIGWLYDQEEQYRLRHLTPEQIRKERQGEKTAKVISQIRQRLDKLLADGNGMRGDLMQKALNYLKSFWDQLILYLKDGRYCIDNSLAERTLRPMTVERKNSLTFGSHAGAKVSVIYHTFIETCKMCGVSTLEYFKEFFKAIMQGRTDYENLLPMTIGINK